MTTGKFYIFLKVLARIILPTFGALYFLLSAAWGLPNTHEVVGTTMIAIALLGGLLGLSSAVYDRNDAEYDGAIYLGESNGDQRSFRLELPLAAEDVEAAKQILLEVKHPE